VRVHRRLTLPISLPLPRSATAWLATATLLGACTVSPLRTEGDAARSTEHDGVRIVEVLAKPVNGPAGAFVELRNDSDSPVSLTGWSLKVGNGQAMPLAPRQVQDSIEAARGVDPSNVPGHSLALVVDAGMTAEAVAAAACESPIAVDAAKLPAGGTKKKRDALVAALRLQAQRHCIPVFTAGQGALGNALAGGPTLSLNQGNQTRDRATGEWAGAPVGVAFERTTMTAEGFRASPVGSTPGTRNFFSSDPAQLAENARPPINVMHAPAWRAGDLVESHWREQREKLAQAEATQDAAEATRLREEAAAARARATSLLCDEVVGAQDYTRCLAEKEHALPHNPLVHEFDGLVAEADTSVVGSFYQINDSDVVESLIQATGCDAAGCESADGSRAPGRGVDIRLTTDAGFIADPHYVPGFDRLRAANVGIVFDQGPNGADRAPLSHNKFLVVDGEWLWTGSFNPIEDEPARVHADNALILHSPILAGIHSQEFETLFGGNFGIMKRTMGVGGGEVWIDGASVEVRFSPGLAEGQLATRAKAILEGRDACNITVASTGANVIEDRYRNLDPCGGPLDLIEGEIARATSSIYFVAFSLSLNEAADLMIERIQNGGVEVKGVVDPTVVGRGAPSRILEAGGDVRYTPNSDPGCNITPNRFCPINPDKVWLHHKFVVIDYGTDHAVVLTGSHNLSDSAEGQNDETLVVVRDRAVAEAYYRIFREAFDHPQTMGDSRQTTAMPGIAITEVRGTTDPNETQWVEIANFGTEEASLEGLELWNRRTSFSLGSTDTLAPGDRAVIVIGNAADVDTGDALVLEAERDAAPFIGPATALALRDESGNWVATYDPYTSAMNLPSGVAPAAAGGAVEWLGFDGDRLADRTAELLGHKNPAPAGTRFSWDQWQPRGRYSEWTDEHDVSANTMILASGVSMPWTPAQTAGGTPGR